MTHRVFPIEEWAPSTSRPSTSDFSTLCQSLERRDTIEHRVAPTSFRRRLKSLSFGKESDLEVATEKLSLRDNLRVPDTEKKEGGLRGLIRRASVTMRKRRHSHNIHEQSSLAPAERPQTASTWHRLRQAASFSRNSRSFPTQYCEQGDQEPFQTDSAEYLWPRPGHGNAPPIIPWGYGGEAARATAAAQNEFLFGRGAQLLSPEHQLEDRESGIGIAFADYQDASIDRVDFITKLPNELVIHILDKLDHHSLVRAALVSKAWYRVSCDNHIWREAFLREKAKTYAMSGPVQMGTGMGIPSPNSKHNFKDLYRIRQELERNWLEGKAEAIYLNGHTDSIYCVQFDEYKIVTGSRDKTIRVWDMKTYACTLVFGPPTILCNESILTNENGKLQHYATWPDQSRRSQSTPRVISYDMHHNQSILCLQYDKDILVTGSSDSTCIVYDIKDTYRPMMRLERHSAAVLDLAFDDRYIVTCSKDVSICVWDRSTGTLLKQLRGHTGPVNAVQMRGNTIVSCSGDFRVKLWNIDTGKNIREFSGHSRGLACSQFSDDSRFIASAGNDKIIRIWDANTGVCLQTIAAHENLVRSLHIDSVSGRLISGSYDQDIKVFDMESGRLLLDFPKWHSSWVLGAKSDYRRIISTGQDPKILIMDFGMKVQGIENLESRQ